MDGDDREWTSLGRREADPLETRIPRDALDYRLFCDVLEEVPFSKGVIPQGGNDDGCT